MDCPNCGKDVDNLAKHNHQFHEALEVYAAERSKSEIQKEIKDLQEYINVASFENPLNMGDSNDKLSALQVEWTNATEAEDEEGDDELRAEAKWEQDGEDEVRGEEGEDEPEKKKPRPMNADVEPKITKVAPNKTLIEPADEEYDEDDGHRDTYDDYKPNEAEEIEHQEDKPEMSQKEWEEDLAGLKDEYATEDDKDEVFDTDNFWEEGGETDNEDDKLAIDNDEDLFALHKGIMDKPVEEAYAKEDDYPEEPCAKCGVMYKDHGEEVEDHKFVEPRDVESEISTEGDKEGKCEGCDRDVGEDELNNDGYCEDCVVEQGIDYKESEREAYDADVNYHKRAREADEREMLTFLDSRSSNADTIIDDVQLKFNLTRPEAKEIVDKWDRIRHGAEAEEYEEGECTKCGLTPVEHQDVDDHEFQREATEDETETSDDGTDISTVMEPDVDDSDTDAVATFTMESWDGRTSFNTKVEAFEALGITQGDSLKLAELNWRELSIEVRGALNEFADNDKEEKRIDSQDAFNDEGDGVGSQPDTQIKDLDSIDYNIIGDNPLGVEKYECEHCNSGFKSNEALMIHYNDIHASAKEFLLDVPNSCNFCGKEIPSDISMGEHLAYEHGISLDTKLENGMVTDGAEADDAMANEEEPDPDHMNPTKVEDYDYESDKPDAEEDFMGKPDLDGYRCDGCGKLFDDIAEGVRHVEDEEPYGTTGKIIYAGESLKKKSIAKEVWKPHIYKATEAVSYAEEEFKEDEHPREDSGKFTSGGGGGAKSQTKDKPKLSKNFNKAKSKVLKAFGTPKGGDSWQTDQYNKLNNLDGYPQHSSQLKNLGVKYKAPIMKAHLNDTYPDNKWSVRVEYFSMGSAINGHWIGGGGYPYGSNEKVAQMYTDSGASNMMVDYSDVDNYVSLYDGRPNEEKGQYDPQTIAKSREQRIEGWIRGALDRVDYQDSLNWSKTVAENLAKDGKLISFQGMTDSHKEQISKVWGDFQEQEKKEGGISQKPKETPKSTTPAFHTQQYMNEDPDKPSEIPIDLDTGKELPVSNYNPNAPKYRKPDVKDTKADVDKARSIMKGQKGKGEEQPWQEGGEAKANEETGMEPMEGDDKIWEEDDPNIHYDEDGNVIEATEDVTFGSAIQDRIDQAWNEWNNSPLLDPDATDPTEYMNNVNWWRFAETHGLSKDEADQKMKEETGEVKANEHMLDPKTTDITTCIVCGIGIDQHNNPNVPFGGREPTDHYYLGGDLGGSDDKLDFESYAKEAEEKYECNLCHQQFDDQDKAIAHTDSAHSELDWTKIRKVEDAGEADTIKEHYKCEDCGKIFEQESELEWHYDEKHKDANEGGVGSGPQKGSTGPSLLPEQSAMAQINPDYDVFSSEPNPLQTDPNISQLKDSEAEEAISYDKCPNCNFETSWKEGDDWQKDDAKGEMDRHIDSKHGTEAITNQGAEIWWDSITDAEKLETAPLSLNPYNQLTFEEKRDVNHAFMRYHAEHWGEESKANEEFMEDVEDNWDYGTNQQEMLDKSGVDNKWKVYSWIELPKSVQDQIITTAASYESKSNEGYKVVGVTEDYGDYDNLEEAKQHADRVGAFVITDDVGWEYKDAGDAVYVSTGFDPTKFSTTREALVTEDDPDFENDPDYQGFVDGKKKEPSQYTQDGISQAMADPDWDKLDEVIIKDHLNHKHKGV